MHHRLVKIQPRDRHGIETVEAPSICIWAAESASKCATRRSGPPAPVFDVGVTAVPVAIPSTTHSIDRSDASCGRNPAPSHEQDRGDRPKCSCQAIIGVRSGLGSGKGAYQYACCKQSAAPVINCSIEACIATQPTSWASLARRNTIFPKVPSALPRIVVSGADDRGRAPLSQEFLAFSKSLQTLHCSWLQGHQLAAGGLTLRSAGSGEGHQISRRLSGIRAPPSCLPDPSLPASDHRRAFTPPRLADHWPHLWGIADRLPGTLHVIADKRLVSSSRISASKRTSALRLTVGVGVHGVSSSGTSVLHLAWRARKPLLCATQAVTVISAHALVNDVAVILTKNPSFLSMTLDSRAPAVGHILQRLCDRRCRPLCVYPIVCVYPITMSMFLMGLEQSLPCPAHQVQSWHVQAHRGWQGSHVLARRPQHVAPYLCTVSFMVLLKVTEGPDQR